LVSGITITTTLTIPEVASGGKIHPPTKKILLILYIAAYNHIKMLFNILNRSGLKYDILRLLLFPRRRKSRGNSSIRAILDSVSSTE
jgi:hypothetical protein